MGRVEALWQELFGALPLLLVHVKAVHVDEHCLVGLNVKRANLGVLIKLVEGGHLGSFSQAQSLTEHLRQIRHVAKLIIGQLIFEGSFVAASALDTLIKLSSHLS